MITDSLNRCAVWIIKKYLYSANVGVGTFTRLFLMQLWPAINWINQSNRLHRQQHYHKNTIMVADSVCQFQVASVWNWVQSIAELCNLSQIFANRSGGMKPNGRSINLDVQWIFHLSIFHLLSVLYFYVVLFMPACFLTKFEAEISEIDWNFSRLSRLCNTERCGQTARK